MPVPQIGTSPQIEYELGKPYPISSPTWGKGCSSTLNGSWKGDELGAAICCRAIGLDSGSLGASLCMYVCVAGVMGIRPISGTQCSLAHLSTISKILLGAPSL